MKCLCGQSSGGRQGARKRTSHCHETGSPTYLTIASASMADAADSANWSDTVQ